MPDVADAEDLGELALLPAGSTFGNYVIHECIGQGAMGNVYRAEHALLEKPVALKVLDTALLSSADARQRFLHEGQAAVAIKHPNVVDITDVGVFQGTPYLVMELLEGEDLQAHLQHHEQLSEREVASLLIPVAAALGAAHDRGVVHRDLKPSNIFLARGADGEVVPKILDFGISKLPRGLGAADLRATPRDQLMGSPLYWPPEVVRGSRELIPKSDQYSLGVILYECVTGRPPFWGDSSLSVLNQIARGDFVKPSRMRSDISPAMERAICRALSVDPAQRFDHVRDLGRELLDVADVRTQMLWGRTFGRIDLSEPPFDPRSTSPLVLSRPATSRTSVPVAKARSARHVALGVATLAAILIPNLWSIRSPSAPDSLSPALAEPGQAGEVASTTAVPALGRSITAAAARLSAALPPSPPHASGRNAPSAADATGTLSTAAFAGPAGLAFSAAPGAERAPSASPGAPASEVGADAMRRSPLARATLPSERVTSAAGAARAARRARSPGSAEPRLARAREPEPRATARRASSLDSLAPIFDDLLGPAPAPAARLAPVHGRRGRGLRPEAAGVYAGANESPILD
jgi:eukaryotic-like serine/threonine-protein kinase